MLNAKTQFIIDLGISVFLMVIGVISTATLLSLIFTTLIPGYPIWLGAICLPVGISWLWSTIQTRKGEKMVEERRRQRMQRHENNLF